MLTTEGCGINKGGEVRDERGGVSDEGGGVRVNDE